MATPLFSPLRSHLSNDMNGSVRCPRPRSRRYCESSVRFPCKWRAHKCCMRTHRNAYRHHSLSACTLCCLREGFCVEMNSSGFFIADILRGTASFGGEGNEKPPPDNDGRQWRDKQKAVNLPLPAWVFCTRYSDRPSSGKTSMAQQHVWHG